MQHPIARAAFARLAVLLGLAASPAAAQAPPAACPQFFPQGREPALLNVRLAQRATLPCNSAYAVLASGVTKGAIWSAEHLTADIVSAARDTVRASEFFPDDRLPAV